LVQVPAWFSKTPHVTSAAAESVARSRDGESINLALSINERNRAEAHADALTGNGTRCRRRRAVTTRPPLSWSGQRLCLDW